MLAGDVKPLTYYRTDSGTVRYVTAVERTVSGFGAGVTIGWWRLDSDKWAWNGENEFTPDTTIFMVETERPLDACPADPSAPRPGRLVWRTVGKRASLVEVERGTEEAGDEPFVCWGLTP